MYTANYVSARVYLPLLLSLALPTHSVFTPIPLPSSPRPWSCPDVPAGRVTRGDTCDSLNALFSTQIQPLNPALSCSDGPRPSQLLCVDFNQTWLEQGKTRVPCDLLAQITPTATGATPSPPPPPPLANYTSDGALVTVVQGPQSCQQLWRAFAIASPTRFFQMNPGLSCDSLLPHSPLQGNMMRKV
ncbi:unnamed protein product [Closterium sp. NIES-65]|nr:unnamed protein product [Closterium sp. NIES-65]